MQKTERFTKNRPVFQVFSLNTNERTPIFSMNVKNQFLKILAL